MGDNNPVTKRKALAKIYQILRLDKKDISAIYLFAILAGMVSLSLPVGIQSIIGFVMAGSVSTSIIVLIIMVVAGTFLSGLLTVKQLSVIEKIKQKIFLRNGLEFADRIPKIDLEKTDGDKLPELVNRFFDTISLQKGLEKLLLDLPTAIIQILLGLLLLSFYHPVFIAFGIFLLLITLLIIGTTSNRGFEAAMQSSNEKYVTADWLQQTAKMVHTFKFSQNSFHLLQTDAHISAHLQARTKYFKVLLTQYWSLISFKVLITAAMLIVGTALLVNQQINVGQFIAADIVIITIIGSVEKLILSLDRIYDAMVSVEKLGTVTNAPKEKTGERNLDSSGGGISVKFKEVSYNYGGDKEVLDKLSFEAASGEWLQITGSSGSGKSTIVKLLTGGYNNFGGIILINNEPINSFNLESLRKHAGVLLSSEDIFKGSLWQNISFGNAAISTAFVLEFARLIGLSNFIEEHHDGLERQLESTGKKLPEHIRKKILLLRALAGEQQLLILEDPFSCLTDIETAAVVQKMKTSNNATVIITTNSPIPLAACDKIINL